MQTTLPRLPSKKVLLGIVLAFFGLTLGMYGHSLTNAFVRWDDGMLIYENPAIREITPRSIHRIFTTYDPELYIPLTFFTYQVDYKIGGTNPFPYHLENLVWHTLNALLGAWLVYLLSKRKWLALAVGLLFAVHPLHTEAVEWASARKDVLSTFFYLSSVITYLYYRQSEKKKTYWFSVVLFVLGLLSKIMAVTLPVTLLLLDNLQGRKIMSKKVLLEKAPYFLLSLLFGIIGFLGKTAVVASSSTSSKILMAAKSAVFYLEKIFFPVHLSLLYPYTKDITITSPDFYMPLLVCCLLAVLAFFFYRKQRLAFFGLMLFAVTVAPTFLNFAKGGETDVYFASDRYAYLPSLGILLAAGMLIRAVFSKRRVSDGSGGVILGSLTAVAIAIFSMLSYRQSLVWANTETLFLNVLKQYPESSYVAYNNLGNVYRLRGEMDKAIESYQKAIAVKPNVRTLSNLGAAYRKQGKFTEAFDMYDRAIKLLPKSPIAHYGLGIVYAAQGKLTDARTEYELAIMLDPSYEEAYSNLGNVAMDEGNIDEAILHYQKAIGLNPYLAEAWYNLANAYAKKGETEKAKEAYAEVSSLRPDFYQARINLAIILLSEGKNEEARSQFEEVLKVSPGNAIATSALRQLDAQ